MVEGGLIEEVKDLIENRFDKNLKPLQSIGYKETIEFIESNQETTNSLIEKISISTRQLAKAQKTFFKKVVKKTELNPLEPKQENVSKVINLLSL